MSHAWATCEQIAHMLPPIIIVSSMNVMNNNSQTGLTGERFHNGSEVKAGVEGGCHFYEYYIVFSVGCHFIYFFICIFIYVFS